MVEQLTPEGEAALKKIKDLGEITAKELEEMNDTKYARSIRRSLEPQTVLGEEYTPRRRSRG